MLILHFNLTFFSDADEDWDKNVGDVLWDLTHYVNFDMRNVTAVVRGKVPASYGGNNKFVVDLSTRSGSCDLSIAKELSWKQLALPVEGSNIEVGETF